MSSTTTLRSVRLTATPELLEVYEDVVGLFVTHVLLVALIPRSDSFVHMEVAEDLPQAICVVVAHQVEYLK